MSLHATAAVAQPPRPLTREEAVQVDAEADKMGQPGLVRMENAGLGLTKVVLGELDARRAPPGAVVGIVGGRGNNAGDGFVLARHLALAGYVPKVAYCGDRARAKRDSDAGVNLTVIEHSGVSVTDVANGPELAALLAGEWAGAVLLVDAMLGTGLQGELRADYKAWIEALNAAPQPKVAVDIPSGLDCDTGLSLGAAVRAACTVTFVGPKKGFGAPGADAYTGTVYVASIGCPSQCWAHVAAL